VSFEGHGAGCVAGALVRGDEEREGGKACHVREDVEAPRGRAAVEVAHRRPPAPHRADDLLGRVRPHDVAYAEAPQLGQQGAEILRQPQPLDEGFDTAVALVVEGIEHDGALAEDVQLMPVRPGAENAVGGAFARE
jgi:hypothetical protein